MKIGDISVEIKLGDNPQISTTNASVLLVEDDYISGVLINKLCERKNISLKIAISGKQALEILEHEAFELILMDVQLPNMKGYDIAKIIRDSEKVLNMHTPIIATTACASLGDREKCIEAGMDDYLEKPINIEKFYSIIEKYIFLMRGYSAFTMERGYK